MPTVLPAYGAIDVPSGDEGAVERAARELLAAVASRNRLPSLQVVAAVVGATAALDEVTVAAAVRRAGLGHVPLFAAREPEGPVPRLLTLTAHVRLPRARRLEKVYLGGAAALDERGTR